MITQYILSWEIGSNLCQQEFDSEWTAREAFEFLKADFEDKDMNVEIYLESVTKSLLEYWDTGHDN